MAKIVIDKLVPDDLSWHHMYEQLTLVSNSSKVLKYMDADGDTITFKGKNFTFEGLQVVGGTVTQMIARSSDDYPYVTITNLKVDASTFLATDHPGSLTMRYGTNAGNDSVLGSIQDDLIFAGAGKDKVVGGKGDDRIWGETGNDVLTGGGGTDRFYFAYEERFGKDTITDFDTATELVVLTSSDYAEIKDGKDTVLAFENGDRITLQGVRPAEFDESNVLLLA
jgi:Ca2+-binding RTX toxin-like protein